MRKPQRNRKAEGRPFRDDLPVISISPLRAAGVVTRASTTVILTFGELEREVGVAHVDFPPTRDGKPRSWSFFRCPSCSRRARNLRLYDGRLVCSSCDGLRVRAEADWRRPKPYVIERLRAQLAKPVVRRARLEATLRRALIRERRLRLDGYGDP